MNSTAKTFALAIVLVIGGGASYQTAAQKFSQRPKVNRFARQDNNSAANKAFSGARDLIDDAQWAQAEEQFAKYISSYPQEPNLDAAMYWMAYSEYKLRKFDQSKETIDKLLKIYDKTTWKQDAEMLLAQLPGAPTVVVEPVMAPVAIAPVVVNVQDPARAQEVQERVAEAQARAQERAQAAQERAMERVREAQERIKDRTGYYNFDFDFDFDTGKAKTGDDNDPCEFKIVVLQSLFQSDAQRGMAVATDWLRPNSGQTTTCRRAALTLLARYGGKAATPTILGVAQNDADMKVRTRAISLLGATNDDSVIDALRDFSLNSTQTEITEAALYALSQHSGPRAASILADIAVSNKPLALRRMAIASIASRQGEPPVDALIKIYDSSQDLEIKKAAISGLGHRRSDRAGAKLLEIARGSDNVELRKAAISAIGRRGAEQAIDPLMSLYDAERNEEIKTQILNSLAYSNDQRVIDKLIAIAKNPQTPIERKRRIVMLLSGHSKNPAVIAYFEELLKQ